jgi:hypothetical protein
LDLREKMEILRLEQFDAEKTKILEDLEGKLALETAKMVKDNQILLENAKNEILMEKNLALAEEKRVFGEKKDLESAQEKDEIVR